MFVHWREIGAARGRAYASEDFTRSLFRGEFNRALCACAHTPGEKRVSLLTHSPSAFYLTIENTSVFIATIVNDSTHSNTHIYVYTYYRFDRGITIGAMGTHQFRTSSHSSSAVFLSPRERGFRDSPARSRPLLFGICGLLLLLLRGMIDALGWSSRIYVYVRR